MSLTNSRSANQKRKLRLIIQVACWFANRAGTKADILPATETWFANAYIVACMSSKSSPITARRCCVSDQQSKRQSKNKVAFNYTICQLICNRAGTKADILQHVLFPATSAGGYERWVATLRNVSVVGVLTEHSMKPDFNKLSFEIIRFRGECLSSQQCLSTSLRGCEDVASNGNTLCVDWNPIPTSDRFRIS